MEATVSYRTNGHTPPAAATELVPSAWLRFLYRVAGLQRGRVYTITLVVPEKAQAEPTWAIQAAGILENDKKVAS